VFDREDDVLERVVRHLKRPVHVDPAVDGRVMNDIAALPVGTGGRMAHAWAWLVTPRRVAVSPLGGLALAAAVATLLLVRPWGVAPPRSQPADRFQFVLLAPEAASVSLVGDFNDWDAGRTPMRAARRGVWTAVLPLTPGRYRYAFLVNGSEWIADPAAPRAADDEFGTPSSVVTVGGT
jgi:hypothetical protein